MSVISAACRHSSKWIFLLLLAFAQSAQAGANPNAGNLLAEYAFGSHKVGGNFVPDYLPLLE